MREEKTDSEIFDILIHHALEHLMTNSYPRGVVFDIPGADNEANLQVLPDALDPKNYRFRIAVSRIGSDMLVSNYLEKGSEADLRAYFQKAAADEAEQNRIRAALETLSANVDDKMD